MKRHFVLKNVVYICVLVISGTCLGEGDTGVAISAIVNRNSPPESAPGAIPPIRFGKTYDFNEEKRVVRAIEELQRNAINHWPLILESVDDKRYSITVGSQKAASNFTVGNVCKSIIIGTLNAAYIRHVPPDMAVHFRMRNPEIVKNGEYIQWCRQRQLMGIQLYQVQIEMCEWALKSVVDLDDDLASDEEKAVSVMAIRNRIRELQSTKKAVAPSGFFCFGRELISGL